MEQKIKLSISNTTSVSRLYRCSYTRREVALDGSNLITKPKNNVTKPITFITTANKGARLETIKGVSITIEPNGLTKPIGKLLKGVYAY